MRETWWGSPVSRKVLYKCRSDGPFSGSQLADQMAIRVVQIEKRVAIACRAPDEFVGSLQERKLIIQVNPSIACLRKHCSSLAAVYIRKQQVQFSLIAALA